MSKESVSALKSNLLSILCVLFIGIAPQASASPFVLKTDGFKAYVDRFNRDDVELYTNIPNAQAWSFLSENVPRFECPDPLFEQTYYFRWWTFRKHVKQTPDGFVITEFLPPVPWARKHNTIACPGSHHYYEGRWLRDRRILDDYSRFWLKNGGKPRQYSFWIADAFYARHLVTPSQELLTSLLDDLVKNYKEWETTNRGQELLFHQIDDRDGMEVSIGGSGYRATINAYQYGDAVAIARIATMTDRKELAEEFTFKAKEIKERVQSMLWDSKAQFFKVLPRGENKQLVDVRELHGFTPWYFKLPEPGKGYEVAWKQLMDPKGFYAPFGPTTAEQRHPGFKIAYTGHECQWNGPSWPFATAVTLTALANVLNDYPQEAIFRKDYFETLKIYTKSHQLTREDGKVVPWIDENLNPFTGDWISRTRLKTWKNNTWDAGKGGVERGKDYNHSTYCDLIISGLVGLRPRADDIVEVNPLLPDNTWEWFCLDGVSYHGRELTILWDRTGKRYQRGQGLRVFADGQEIASSPSLERVKGRLPAPLVK